MYKLTRKQILFLAVYPIVHCLLSIFFLLMAISTGLGPPDAGDHPVSVRQEIAANIGGFALNILWAPVFLVERVIDLRHGLFQDYLWISLAGLVYAVLAVLLYKSITRK